jgi:hypothetical protein
LEPQQETIPAPAFESTPEALSFDVTGETSETEPVEPEPTTASATALDEISETAWEPVSTPAPLEASPEGADAVLPCAEPAPAPQEAIAEPPAPDQVVSAAPIEAPLDFSALEALLAPAASAPDHGAPEEFPQAPEIDAQDSATENPEVAEPEVETPALEPVETAAEPQVAEPVPETSEAAAQEASAPNETPPKAEDTARAEESDAAGEVIFSDSELLPLRSATVDAANPIDLERTVQPLDVPADAEPQPVADAYPIPKFLFTKCEPPARRRLSSMIVLHTLAALVLLVVVGTLVYAWNPLDIGTAARAAILASTTTAAPPAAPAIPTLAAANLAQPASAEVAGHPMAAMLLDDPPVEVRSPALTPSAPAAESAKSPPPVAEDTAAAESPAPPAPPAPVDEIASAPPAAPAEPPIPVAPTVAALPLPAGDLDALVKRGDDLLGTGDVMAARSAYERAAYGGNAAAAIGMGKTYDPLFLAQLGARGVHGDPIQAAYWYARARDAGDREGDRRLRALFSGIQKCVISQGACASPGRKG